MEWIITPVRILQKSQKYLLIFLIPEQEHILILESGNQDKPSSSASVHVSGNMWQRQARQVKHFAG